MEFASTNPPPCTMTSMRLILSGARCTSFRQRGITRLFWRPLPASCAFAMVPSLILLPRCFFLDSNFCACLSLLFTSLLGVRTPALGRSFLLLGQSFSELDTPPQSLGGKVHHFNEFGIRMAGLHHEQFRDEVFYFGDVVLEYRNNSNVKVIEDLICLVFVFLFILPLIDRLSVASRQCSTAALISSSRPTPMRKPRPRPQKTLRRSRRSFLRSLQSSWPPLRSARR